MNPNDLKRMLLEAIESDETGESESKETEKRRTRGRRKPGKKGLATAVKRLVEAQDIKPGDIVRWKQDKTGIVFRNRVRPQDTEQVVVTARLDTPMYETAGENGSGSRHFNEPLDLRVALFDDNGDLLEFWLDSRRLERVPDTEPSDDLGALLDVAAIMMRPRTLFKPGDVLEWVPGLKNKRAPELGQPVVAVEQYPHPIDDPTNASSGSAYFREPLDLVCAMVDEDDGELMLFHYDSRRFRLKT